MCADDNSVELSECKDADEDNAGIGGEKNALMKEYSAVPLSSRTRIKERKRASTGSFWHTIQLMGYITITAQKPLT